MTLSCDEDEKERVGCKDIIAIKLATNNRIAEGKKNEDYFAVPLTAFAYYNQMQLVTVSQQLRNRDNYCCKTVVSKQFRNLFQELETLRAIKCWKRRSDCESFPWPWVMY